MKTFPKHSLRTIVNQIIMGYNRSSYIKLDSYLDELEKNNSSIYMFKYEEIPTFVFRYIRIYSLHLIAEFTFRKIEYEAFKYLQFKSKPDIVRFLKVTTGFRLPDCLAICNKYQPFNSSEL